LYPGGEIVTQLDAVLGIRMNTRVPTLISAYPYGGIPVTNKS